MATNYGERIARMEERTENIDKKLDEVLKRFDSLDKNLERRFAAKWVQSVVGGLVSLILISVTGALLTLVVKG